MTRTEIIADLRSNLQAHGPFNHPERAQLGGRRHAPSTHQDLSGGQQVTVSDLRQRLAEHPGNADVFVSEGNRSGLTVVAKKREGDSTVYETTFIEVPAIGFDEDWEVEHE
jgi:hypothetical protein